MTTPQQIHKLLETEFPFFAENAPLLITHKKGGELRPFIFNRVQQHIHDKLEEQKKKLGRVRACIVKGRQQGCSTYVSGRYYHKSRQKGISVFILSHDGKATDKLFSMVKRYQKYIHPSLRLEEGASNKNQLKFSKLESDYTVGTAGNEDVGRGGTSQLFHWSEAAYCKNDYAIQDGALESIGDVSGTEIILESTGNGPKGLFHDICRQAMKGKGDYILIFVPWFWQEEYERDYDGEELTEEEQIYLKVYLANLPKAKALRKILWRRNKIFTYAKANSLEAGHAKFKRIYPSTPIEAFQATGVGLIRADAIMAARKSTLIDEVSPIIAGVDPAGDSDSSDRTVIAIRKGRHLQHIIKHTTMRPMKLAAICANLIDQHGIDMMFIDRGYGEGTIDRLHELGYGRKVQGIAFNEGTLFPDVYLNKRSEIIIRCADWMNAGGVRIPDDDEVHADFACMPLDEETPNNLRFLPPKRVIKQENGGVSPDIYDATALTFAYPVRRDLGFESGQKRFRKVEDTGPGVTRKNHGPLKSLRRMRGRG